MKINVKSRGYCLSTLPPDLVTGANPAGIKEDPSAYMSRIQEKLKEVHRRVAPMVASTRPNPYELGNLIWVTTPPLERSSKLSLKWIGPYWVMKVLNPYQEVYARGAGAHIVHIHHTKPALLDLLSQELHDKDDPPAASPVGYFSTALTHKPVARNQARGASRVTTPQPSQPPSSPGDLVAGPLADPGSSSTNQQPAATGSVAAIDPALKLGSESLLSSSATADTLSANENAATRGTVTGRGGISPSHGLPLPCAFSALYRGCPGSEHPADHLQSGLIYG